MALTTFSAYSPSPGVVGFYLAHDTLNFTSDISVAGTSAFKSVPETEQTYEFPRLSEGTSYAFTGNVQFEDGTSQVLAGNVITKSRTISTPVVTQVVSATATEKNLTTEYPYLVNSYTGKRVVMEAAAAGVLVRFDTQDSFIPLTANVQYTFGGVSNVYYKSGGTVNLTIAFDNLNIR